MTLTDRRRFFAEEIEAVAKLRSPSLVEALATVPREAFLPAGPWTVMAESDYTGMAAAKTRVTADADPARVCHNIGVAIDPERMLFNGQPATLASWIDALELSPGARVMHVGAGLGYYTAVMAHCVGRTGRVLAFEADNTLAAQARLNLAGMPWVEVRAGASAEPGGETLDAILINAGVTHAHEAWLDAPSPGGSMILPITATMGPNGNIGKGLVVELRKNADATFGAAVIGFVAIFSAVGLRDEVLNGCIGKLLMTGPPQWSSIARLRRDPHAPELSCRLHGNPCCLSA